MCFFFFFQAEDGIRDGTVTGVQTCALPIYPTLWKPDDPKHQAEIADRFGWLALVERMETRVAELKAFAAEARRDGFARALVCGRGGSSLAPEVLRRTF